MNVGEGNVTPLDAVRSLAGRRGGESEQQYRNLIETLPAAIYTTDAHGRVTFFNRAAAELAGRQPLLGTDEWCVTWRLFWPDGRPMPHSECPMAVALKEGRAVRGQEIVAQRPDGTRAVVMPYPTPLFDASGRLLGAVNMLVDITDRKRMEQDLQRMAAELEERVDQRTRDLARTVARLEESERTARLLIEGATDYAIFMLNPTGHVVSWNPGAERIKGYTRRDIVGQHFSCFYTEEDRQAGIPYRLLETARASGRVETDGWRVRKNGSRFWASVVIDAIRDRRGELIGFAKITRDMTERRQAEERLRQSQKMEAIGQLTGGVAHDFNNLLTVIMGSLEVLDRVLPDAAKGKQAERARRAVSAAFQGARKAADLTHRLLAFSRQQALQPKMVDVTRLALGMCDMLRRTLGERIGLETNFASDWRILADPNQLENALLNLAVNARDAMPDGGTLTIETVGVTIDEACAKQHETRPGQYVAIAVRDTGIGMDQATLKRVFEPFFTTKPMGQGTGLGLSMVYGFATQSGGHVQIHSERGVGTTVKLYLPRLAEVADETPDAASRVTSVDGGEELILLVEDDAAVRAHNAEALRDLGYRVLAAENADKALDVLERHPDIALLFTDIGLPGPMNGRELADEARRRRPDLKVLCTSGYARDAIIRKGNLAAGVLMIVKPFTYAGLAAKIREALGS